MLRYWISVQHPASPHSTSPFRPHSIPFFLRAGGLQRQLVDYSAHFPMPNQTWTVPCDAWHADEPTFVDRDTPMGILAFVFLDDVQPKGGATVVLSGSPRLLQGGPAGNPEDKPVLQCRGFSRGPPNRAPLLCRSLERDRVSGGTGATIYGTIVFLSGGAHTGRRTRLQWEIWC